MLKGDHEYNDLSFFSKFVEIAKVIAICTQQNAEFWKLRDLF